MHLQADSRGRPSYIQDAAGFSYRINAYRSGGRVDVTITNPAGDSWRGVVSPSEALTSRAPRAMASAPFTSGLALTAEQALHHIIETERLFCETRSRYESELLKINASLCAVQIAAGILVAGPLGGIGAVLHCGIGAQLGKGLTFACQELQKVPPVIANPDNVVTGSLPERNSPQPPPTTDGPTSPPPPGPTVTSIAVSASATSVVAGATVTVSATASYSNGTSGAITPTWSSSNTAVATVSSSGTVTAVAAGTTTITGTFGGQSDAVGLTVVAPVDDPPVLSSITPAVATGSNSQQTFTLSGSDFQSGAVVEWHDLTVGDSGTKAPFAISSGTIQVSLNVTNNTASWRLRVRNPDGQPSGWRNFEVVAQ